MGSRCGLRNRERHLAAKNQGAFIKNARVNASVRSPHGVYVGFRPGRSFW